MTCNDYCPLCAAGRRRTLVPVKIVGGPYAGQMLMLPERVAHSLLQLIKQQPMPLAHQYHPDRDSMA